MDIKIIDHTTIYHCEIIENTKLVNCTKEDNNKKLLMEI